MTVRFPFHDEVRLHQDDGSTAVVLVTEMVVDDTQVTLWVRARGQLLAELGIRGSQDLPAGELEVQLEPGEGVEVPRNAAAMRRALRRGGPITAANRWRILATRPVA